MAMTEEVSMVGETTRAVTIPRTEQHVVRSSHVGRDLEVRVALPMATWRGAPTDPFAAVYLPDADLFFGTVVETTRLMHQLFGELPPLLVVGVGYPAADAVMQAELRSRDFTFSSDPGLGGPPASFGPSGREPALPEGERLGGADAFLAFLVDELRPWLREHFEVADRGATLMGSSLGGLFAVYALLTRPGAFDGYVAVSPALWWDHGELFNVESQLAERLEDLAAGVFLAAGELEENARIPGLAEFRLIGNARLMAERLKGRGYPSLDVTFQLFPDESHTSVVPVAFTRALRWLHGRRSTPPGGTAV
jgi:ferri-bacillibactin esterase